MFKKQQVYGEVPGWDLTVYAKAEHKVARMATPLLLDFADAAGSGMALGVNDYRKEANVTSLLEIRHALMTLWAINESLIQRVNAASRIDAAS